MKIRVYSDLHLDWFFADGISFNPVTRQMNIWRPPELPDDKDTVLVLAGDLWVGSKWIKWADYSWIKEVAPRFKEVIVVLGNHDYWPQGGLTIRAAGDKLNAMLQDHGVFNVHVLDMSTKEIDGVLFVGATLWTDMDKGDPSVMYMMPRYMRYDGSISYETGPDGKWIRFTSEKWVSTHKGHRDYIKHVLAQNQDKKVVVVTHHVPLLTLGDPLYLSKDSNAYYMSDLSDIIMDNDNLKLWAYGHTHYQKVSELAGTKLVNNSVGYTSEHHEQEGNVKHEVIEV